MYLVGHAIVAFLLAYGISKRFKIGEVSFALVMLIACLPDIDIILQSLGIIPHKTYTHSLILSAMIVPSIIFVIARWRNVSSGAAIIYSFSYLSHIVIADTVVGSINILYPIGNLMVGSGIGYGTLSHSILEFLVLTALSFIILHKSFKRQQSTTALFNYTNVDKISCMLLIASLIISSAYLIYEIKNLPRLFIKSELEFSLFVLLHISAVGLVSFWLFVCRQYSILSQKAIS